MDMDMHTHEDDFRMEMARQADHPRETLAVAPIATVRNNANFRAVHARSAMDGQTMRAVDDIHRAIAPKTACAVGNLLALLESGLEVLAELLVVDARAWPACRIDLCTQHVNPLLLPDEHARCVGRHHRAAYALWGCSMAGASMHIPPDAPILRHLAYPKELYNCERSPYDGALLLLYARQCMMDDDDDDDDGYDDDAYGLLAAREDYPHRFGHDSKTVLVQEAEIERILSRMILSTMSSAFEESGTPN
jgi:hypothetical protein